MRRAALLLLLVAGSGCYRIRYVRQARPEALPAAEQWHHLVLYGLVPLSPPVEVGTLCPRGFAVVENETSFLNALASLAVQGVVNGILYNASGGRTGAPADLWSPSTVKVYCAVEGTPALPEAVPQL